MRLIARLSGDDPIDEDDEEANGRPRFDGTSFDGSPSAAKRGPPPNTEWFTMLFCA